LWWAVGAGLYHKRQLTMHILCSIHILYVIRTYNWKCSLYPFPPDDCLCLSSCEWHIAFIIWMAYRTCKCWQNFGWVPAVFFPIHPRNQMELATSHHQWFGTTTFPTGNIHIPASASSIPTTHRISLSRLTPTGKISFKISSPD